MARKIFLKSLLMGLLLLLSVQIFAQIPGEGWVRIGLSYSGNITALAISPNYETDATLFIGVSGNGLWCSTDRGSTWKMCAAVPSDATVTGIALPRDYRYGAGIPCFAVTQQGYFYSSTSDFATIQYSYLFQTSKVNPATCIVVGGISSFDGTIWVGTWGAGVFRNTNSGSGTWTNPSAEIRALDNCRSLTITNETTQRLWASCAPSPTSGAYPIWRWESGYTWTYHGATALTAEDTLSIYASWTKPEDMWVGTATKGMWRSTDSGATWNTACDGSVASVGFQVRTIRDCPQYVTDNEIWEGRSDGLRASNDGGANCLGGFPYSQINVIGFSPAYHGTGNYCDAFVGTESALFRINCAEGAAAKTPPIIDGKAVAIAHAGKGIFLGSLARGLFKSVDKTTMVEYNNFPNGQIPEIVAICLHPSYYEGGTCGDENTLFVAANFPDCPEDNGVYKSTDAGNSWTKMTGGEWPTTAIEMRDLAISPQFATDNVLFAATSDLLFRWDGTTPCWTRVAKDNAFTNYTFVAVPPQYNKGATCSYSGQAGAPCNMVVVGADRSGSKILAVSYNNGVYFYDKGGCLNPTGIAFPKNYCTGSQPSAKALVSSSTQGVQMTTDILFNSFTSKNSGIPSSLNVADIASDPDWIDSATPTDPYLVCAVPVSSTPETRDFGAYYSDDAGGLWTLKRRGSAVSIDFESPYSTETNSYVLAGFQRDATYGSNPPYGAFLSQDSGSTYVWLRGYYSLPNDVYSTVAHERNPNYIFASSPSMGVFVSKDKGESFRPFNVGKGGSLGPCVLTNGYGITMLADRRGPNLDVIYVGTTDGIKSRYIYYDSTLGKIDLYHEDSAGNSSGWRHSTLSGGGNTTGYWERLEVVPGSSLYYPIWAVSPQHNSTPGQGFANLPAGSYEGWVFQNGGLGSSPNAKGVRVGYSTSTGIQPLTSGYPIKGSVKQGAWEYYSINVTDPNKDLQVFMKNDKNDPDLYVRYGSLPTLSSYDFRPYFGGVDETVCVVPILEENFDESWGPYGNNPPPNWTITTSESPVSWSYDQWSKVSGYAFVWGNVGTTRTSQNERLYSPAFNLASNLTSATLTYYYVFNSGASTEYAGILFYSDQTNLQWIRMYNGSSSSGNDTVDLTPFKGQTNCHIVLYYYDSNCYNSTGRSFYLDNIRITAIRPNTAYPYGPQQMLKTGTWYIGVEGYSGAGDNDYTLTATLDTGCTGTTSFSDPGAGKDPKYANYIPPDPQAPIAGSTWGTVTGMGVVKGTGTTSVNFVATPVQPPNTNVKTIIQLPDTTLIVGCDASSSSDKGIFYSPAGDEGQTQWIEASSVAGTSSKDWVDIIQASNGDVLIAANGSGSTPGGVWLSGDKGGNWMRISQGFDSTSQALEDIVADGGDPVSYYASTDATGLWTRTITASPYPTITGISPNNGSDQGGTSVTITGSGFSNSCPTGTSSDCPNSSPFVIFGDTEVAGTYVSPTQITAVTPAHSQGAVAVKVRNPDTRETSSGVTYTFNFTCLSPSGFSNNTAVDYNGCADNGVKIDWSAPSDWGDGGSGTRTYDVLRNGSAIATGLSSTTLTYTDTTGENGTTYTYQVRANNGCGLSTTTTGASAADNVSPSVPSITSITDIDPNNLTGIIITYSSGSPATRHDLYKDGGLAQENFVSGSTFVPGDSLVHNFVIRAVNGSCFSDSSSVQGQDQTSSSPPPEIATGSSYPDDSQWWEGNIQHWPSSSLANGYKLYRLTKGDLPNLLNSSDEGCYRDTGSTNSYNCSSDDPSSIEGRVYFYLVTGYNGAGEGSAGNGRQLSSSTLCP